MGIVTEETKMPEGAKIEDEIFESNQSGTYKMIRYVISWSLDLSSNTITLNIINKPDFGTKVINKDNPVAEYRIDEPWYQRFLAKISADFNSRQLILNGHVTYLTSSPRPSERARTQRYENVIITSW